MKTISLGLLAAVLLTLGLAAPASAQLAVRDAYGVAQKTCVRTDGAGFQHPCDVLEGLYGGAPKAWTMDTNGFGGINVFSSVLPTGGSTSYLQQQLLALDGQVLQALGNPLQAGGVVVAQGSSGDGAVPTAPSIPIAGTDPGGAKRTAATDALGRFLVYIAGRSGSADGVAPINPSDPIAGTDAGGLKRTLRVGADGGLAAPQGTPASSGVISLSANSPQLIRAASPNSRGVTLQTEAANSAPIYICYTQTTSCSASLHDVIIQVSTAIGAQPPHALFGVTTPIYAFTTSATSISADDWQGK